ncbi:MAG: hypothetical protein ACFFDN_31135 [Candidatus Hodarchaeota archaeon]
MVFRGPDHITIPPTGTCTLADDFGMEESEGLVEIYTTDEII